MLRVGRDYKSFKMALGRGEFRARASGHVAGITLGMGGAALGTTLGSVIPGVGSILGGFAGSLIGDYAGIDSISLHEIGKPNPLR